jgi:predicted outer membrane repeat protein
MNHRLFSPFARPPGSRLLRRRLRPLLDPLEPRLLLSTYTVTSTADTATEGTLRQAILDANNNPGADTIVFDASFYSGPHTILIDSAPPQINQQLTITGPGSSLLTIQRGVGGIASSRQAFNSFATVLSLSGMTVTGGATTGAGGGLSAVGGGPNVTLDDMVFTNNSANGFGGAIYLGNNATLTIRNSMITGNSALSGGGIFFFSAGSLVMENTTLSGNSSTATGSATGGGGLYFDATALAAPPAGYTPNTLIIRNSTFSKNTSASFGGAIHMDTLTGTLDIQNSTLSGNSAISGGGIALTSGAGALLVQNSTITLNTASGTSTTTGGGGIFRNSILNNTITISNSIVSGNTNANAPDIQADHFTTTHVNFSAIGSAAGFTLAADSGNNLPFGANLKLGALASNGGPTQTDALLAGSPLIDAGSNARIPIELTTDQRGTGFARISNAVVDIGAFESSTGPLTVTAAQFAYLTAPQSLQFTFSQSVAASVGINDMVLKNLTTGATVPVANLALQYDANLNTATYTFPGYPHGALPDGNYRATVAAAGLSDASGHPLAADFTFDFFFLDGDANHDRTVAFADLVAVAQNYGATANTTFAKGDFNYDGKIDFADLVTVAQKYGTTLPVAALSLPASNLAAAWTSPTPRQDNKTLFALTPITKPVPRKFKTLIPSRHG